MGWRERGIIYCSSLEISESTDEAGSDFGRCNFCRAASCLALPFDFGPNQAMDIKRRGRSRVTQERNGPNGGKHIRNGDQASLIARC